MASADLLLHPVGLRIIKAFLGDRALTTSQLAAELHDVPAGSIYRHVSRLAREGVLQVAAEQRVRGAVERTYTLRPAAAVMQPGEIAAMTPADHTRAFTAFIAGVLDHFDRYIATGPAEPEREAGYRMAAMWLTGQEYAQLLSDLAAVIQPRVANTPRKGGRRRILYGIALPDPGQAANARTPGRRGQASPGNARKPEVTVMSRKALRALVLYLPFRIQSWVTPKAAKGGASGIEGWGVHAVEAMAAGEAVAVKGGHIVDGSAGRGVQTRTAYCGTHISPGPPRKESGQ